MTLVKSDGLGFRILGPQDLPVVHLVPANKDRGPDPVNTDMSSNSENSSASPEENALIEFLERRKQSRRLFEQRYSKRAVGYRAYVRQKDSRWVDEPLSFKLEKRW